MEKPEQKDLKLAPAWRYAALFVFLIGMAILGFLSADAYRKAPPIPERVVGPDGETVFTGDDIRTGQQVFLRYGLMENGSIWGHGAYLGPDFSAAYLHELAIDANENLAREMYGKPPGELTGAEQGAVEAETREILKKNRYDPESGTLGFTAAEVESFRDQMKRWRDYFSGPEHSGGLPAGFLRDEAHLRDLTAFFAWTAWASVAQRPGKNYSYTNNFPYDPLAGNTLTSDAILWSALSVVMLLGGLAVVLFTFGKFDYLGWKGEPTRVRPEILPGHTTPSQRAVIKFFVVVSLLFLAQTLIGGALAHFRAEPGDFYGFDLSILFPSNILRTWHLQLALFWIATAYVAGGLLLASSLGGEEPKRQAMGVHILFWALVIVVVGSLAGEMAGARQWMGDHWSLVGHQGWEYLDLGRLWQGLLVAGLLLWLFLLYRYIKNAKRDPERREIIFLFLGGAIAIPLFYLPAFFFNGMTNFSVVDIWRFWIIHLWVEGFFELFVTVMVAVTFFQLGIVSRLTVTRIIYLDAILFLSGGVVGTAHHWYWTGQSSVTMAFAAMFSALEVVPLTLLTLDAWDFIRLTGAGNGKSEKGLAIPHKWAFFFLMSVGFWNFIGAGVFGFLINMPVVSYYEVGTMLTTNHGHAALMGAFGMLAMALMVLAFRQTLPDEGWRKIEPLIKTGFWGLNIGLALMVVTNLFPGGIFQLWDVIENGYWHARSSAYMSQDFVRLIEWLRMPADLVFILLGAVPISLAAIRTWLRVRKAPETPPQ
ncbi:MAG: nitric-oxide reductase large subunit [Desulfococcaceae bacterium]